MFDKTHKNYKVWVITLDRLAQNNIRNKFVELSKRSSEDQQEFYQSSNELDRIREEYDKEHPVEPCESCGWERSSFYREPSCMNIGKCKNAPTAFGG